MKAARDNTKWTNREIEADSVGYRAAQEAYKADQDRRIRELEDALATKAGAKRCAVVWVLEQFAQWMMAVRSYHDERLLVGPETESARRCRPQHPEEGGSEDLRCLDAHPGEVSQTKKTNRRPHSETISRTHALDLRHFRRVQGLVEATRRER